MSTFLHECGLRLAEERERLGFTQTSAAAIGRVARRTQINYERGERAPDAAYLAELHQVGADTHYVITGTRMRTELRTGGGLAPEVVRMSIETIVTWMNERDLELPPAKLAEAVLALCALADSPEQVLERAPPVLRLVTKMAA